MLSELSKIFKITLIVSGVITGLVVVGNLLNKLINFSYLTEFFILLRKLIMPFDFFLDTNTLFKILSLVLAFQVGVWSFRGYLAISKWFIEK